MSKKKNPEELAELAKFYFLNKKFEKSVEKYKEAIKLNPDDPHLHYNLGIVYESMNILDLAKKSFRKALNLDENFTSAKEHLEKLVGK